MVEPDRSQMTIWPTCISRWMLQTIDTHSEYAIFIAYPQQK